MSNLAKFSPDELDQGLKELEELYKGMESLKFKDKLIFISIIDTIIC